MGSLVLRRVFAPLGLAAALLATSATAASASHGGGGGGTTPPPTPAIQVAPDAATLASGSSEFVQVVVSPAIAAGGGNLTVTASSSALQVSASVPIDPTVRPQFQVTAGTVGAATPVTLTVSQGTQSGSASITVQPAATPTLAPLNIFPRTAASGDPLTVSASLNAAAPPGGVTVTLHSDSATVPVPATVFIPAGQSQTQVPVTAATVTAVTVAHVTETLGSASVTGQVEIDPSRVLSALTLSAPSVDGAIGGTGGVSISVPSDGDTTFIVDLHSSNPSVANVPSQVSYLDGQTSTTFPITTTQVDTATPVTITATAGGVTKTASLTVTPTPPPPFDLAGISVAPGKVAGAGTATGTVTTTVGAPAGGVTIPLSSSDPKIASVPASIFLPAGATKATFPVRVTNQSGSVAVGLSALFQNQGPSTILDVTGAQGGTVIVHGNQNQRLAPKPVGDSFGALGFYGGGVGHVESGQMPPGISLVNNIRPGEFVFVGTVQKPGTYTFVLEFTGTGTPYAQSYVWVITPN